MFLVDNVSPLDNINIRISGHCGHAPAPPLNTPLADTLTQIRVSEFVHGGVEETQKVIKC